MTTLRRLILGSLLGPTDRIITASHARRGGAVDGSVSAVSTEHFTDPPVPVGSLRQRLRAALPEAMRARDRAAVAAAVAVKSSGGQGLAIEQTPLGVGAAEVERCVLTDAQVEDIVRTEVAEREAAARDYDRAGQRQRAELLQSEIGVLSAHLAAHGGFPQQARSRARCTPLGPGVDRRCWHESGTRSRARGLASTGRWSRRYRHCPEIIERRFGAV